MKDRIFSWFRGTTNSSVTSGDVNLIKPEIAIYELAISRFNLTPEETVFVDDKKENIDAAKKLNFITVHLTDPNKIKVELEKYIN